MKKEVSQKKAMVAQKDDDNHCGENQSDAEVLEEEKEIDEKDESEDDRSKKKKSKKVVKTMSKEELENYNKEIDMRGIIYLPRLPPFMKAQKLRHLMSEFGEVGRIYLTPEDASAARKRKKFGGNTGKKFVDGWVEFANKKIAKRVALSLNNTNIGGKKGNYYRDDIWNMKYLKGFKWSMLTEKVSLDALCLSCS